MNRPPIQARAMRALVERSFCELGATPAVATALEEDILIRSGRACARSYRAGGLLAMWMIDIDLVQFYDDDGELLRTYTVREHDVPVSVRRAA